MGFLPDETVYKLVFEDPSMEGLEVRARSVPLGPLMDLLKMADRVKDIVPTTVTAKDMEDVERLFTGFVGSLVEWNLERRTTDGGTEVVPATMDGIRSQDLTLMMKIVKGWIDAVSGVSAPLEPSSPGGEPIPVTGVTFPESQLPMEPLGNPLSSLTHA
jgi:hypothetical protein